MSELYATEVTATGGRQGDIKSDDGILQLELAPPAGLGGPGGKTNPEQMFAGGFAACFGNAVIHTARAQKLPVKDRDVEVVARVGGDLPEALASREPFADVLPSRGARFLQCAFTADSSKDFRNRSRTDVEGTRDLVVGFAAVDAADDSSLQLSGARHVWPSPAVAGEALAHALARDIECAADLGQ